MTRIRIDVSAATAAGYDVVVATDALRTLGELVSQAAAAHRYVVITDRNVAQHWADVVLGGLASAGLLAESIVIDPGEAHKTRETWAAITDRMLETGLGRDSAVIALGGGVVGDLAGFVAATYMRGVPVVQVPTTLLAMIDAAIGGKTGVDVAAGKNLVGAFHQPRLVVVDPATLQTLPAPELRGGLAEALKHGAIADQGYFNWVAEASRDILAGDLAALTALVLGSIRIKAAYVALDTRESGPRAALNFGHTLGHAIERASGYTLQHGYAVALGMVGEAALGEALGLTEPGTRARLAAAASAIGLPTALPADLAPIRIVELTRADKKARQGTTRYALIAGLGRIARGPGGEWTWPIDDDAVMQTLRSLAEV